jgi:(S)-mandelate dehydrogenase
MSRRCVSQWGYRHGPRNALRATSCECPLSRKLEVPCGSAPLRRRRAAFGPQGDLALARAAHKAGIPFALSPVSNMSIEEVAHGVNGDLRFQLYVVHRDLARSLVRRARVAG